MKYFKWLNWKPSPTAKWVLALGLVTVLGASLSWNPSYFSIARHDYVGTGSHTELASGTREALPPSEEDLAWAAMITREKDTANDAAKAAERARAQQAASVVQPRRAPIDIGKVSGIKQLEQIMVFLIEGVDPNDPNITYTVVEVPKNGTQAQSICISCIENTRATIKVSKEELNDAQKLQSRVADALLEKGKKRVEGKPTVATTASPAAIVAVQTMPYDSSLCEKSKIGKDKTISEVLSCQKTQLSEILQECKNLYEAIDKNDEKKRIEGEKKCALTAKKFFDNEIESVLKRGLAASYTEIDMPLSYDYDTPIAYRSAVINAQRKNVEKQRIQREANQMRKDILDTIAEIPTEYKDGKEAINYVGRKISAMTEKSLEEGATFFYDYAISSGMTREMATLRVNDWVRQEARRGGVTNAALRRTLTALNDQTLINRLMNDEFERPLTNFDIISGGASSRTRTRSDYDARTRGRGTDLRYGYRPENSILDRSNYPTALGGNPSPFQFPWQQGYNNPAANPGNYPARQ